VDGPAVGAGLGVALGCDVRIAGPTASFSAPFVRLGLGPDFGLSRRLVDAVGEGRALELLYSGRSVDAAEALELGLVQAVEENPLATALEWSAALAEGGGAAAKATKRCVRLARRLDTEDVLRNLEPQEQGMLLGRSWSGRGPAD